jgi:hypothetical protein
VDNRSKGGLLCSSPFCFSNVPDDVRGLKTYTIAVSCSWGGGSFKPVAYGETQARFWDFHGGNPDEILLGTEPIKPMQPCK